MLTEQSESSELTCPGCLTESFTCSFFSHYNEGHNGEHGFCGCFQTCAWPSSEGCARKCGTHEVFFPEDIFTEETEELLDSGETFGAEQEVELAESGQPRPGPETTFDGRCGHDTAGRAPGGGW